MVICPYCGKEYKSEKNLEKHLLKCEIKQRFDIYNQNSLLRYNFIWFYKYLMPYSLKNIKEKDLPLFFCKNKYYKRLWNLTLLEMKLELYSPEDYMKYLVTNKINFNEWSCEQHMLNFIYEWSFGEPLDHAIFRSEKYLNEHGWSLDNINTIDLYNALRYGKISYKYIKEKNFDYANKLDLLCDIEELRFLKYFLRG